MRALYFLYMRETVTIVGLAVVAALIGFIAFSYSGAPGLVPTEERVPGVEIAFTELAAGERSSVTRRVNYLITSSEELAKLWKMIDSSTVPPRVDFDNRQVIAVFAGEQPTAGHAIAITRITDQTVREVEILITKPGGSCLLAESLTQPYQIIEVPKTDLTLTHRNTATTTSCLR